MRTVIHIIKADIYRFTELEFNITTELTKGDHNANLIFKRL